MTKTENVAQVMFRRDRSRYETYRGYETTNIAEGVVTFFWPTSKQVLAFPLDTIDSMIFSEEEVQPNG